MIQDKKVIPVILIFSLPLLGICDAQASSQFSSAAAINFTIDNISNQTNPGTISSNDLAIFASFDQDKTSYDSVNGDATIHNLHPSESRSIPLNPGANYSHTFSLIGSANAGSLESYHLGLYGLTLFNAGTTDTYQVDLSFGYSLSANAGGQSADTDVSIDYFSVEDPLFSGADYLYHSSTLAGPVPSVGKSGVFSITLAPGQAGAYLADVVINGNLTAAPVPLPTAIWPFLTGLMGIVGFKKRKSPAVQAA